MDVPFLDLKAQYKTIKVEIDAAIQEVINRTAFAGGSFVQKFEEEFAAYCQCKYAVGVSSGTCALWLSLLGRNIGKNDEVITVPNTFIATVEAISLCGAKPVLVDIDEATYNLNPALLESAITSKTKAIIPVHLFGQMANMDAIMEIARKNNLLIIEDACQAHGAEYKGKKAGSFGEAGCYSFYPGKNLGAYGEAGAVVTNNEELAIKLRILRDHGQTKKYYHDMIGWNARMDGLQAAVLSVKLKYLDSWNQARKSHAKMYSQLLQNTDSIITPFEADYCEHVYHVYAIRSGERDSLMEHLNQRGISCGIHYPITIPQSAAYKTMITEQNCFPIAESCSRSILSLPMYAELTEQQIEYVTQNIIEYLSTQKTLS